jgi:hypothetical protein
MQQSASGPTGLPTPGEMSPGDEAPPGTPGTGEAVCPACGDSGRAENGQTCGVCSGTGKITEGIGGG